MDLKLSKFLKGRLKYLEKDLKFVKGFKDSNWENNINQEITNIKNYFRFEK